MSGKFIILGELNLKLLLPFFLAIIQIIFNIFNRYFPGDRENTVLDFFSTSLGVISVVLIPHIFKFTNIEIKNDNVSNIHKKKCIHYSILIVIFLIFSIMKAIAKGMKVDLTKETHKVSNPFTEGPYIYIGIEMILLTIVSIFLLEYKYYIHHFIAIVAFIILGAICDGILGYYSEMIKYDFLTNFIQFLSLVADVINYYYQKYMLEKLYYPYWRISFFQGIVLFVFAISLLIFALIDKDKDNSDIVIISGFYLYFKEVHPGLIVARQLLYMILYFINASLAILNIYYFNPNFILISFHMPKFLQILIDKEPNQYYCLIFFFLQFFSLLIYLEIIELNFCNLNKNTKRNIKLRGIIEISKDTISDTSSLTEQIEINNDYYIDTNENKENESDKVSSSMEMLPKKDMA